MNGASTFLWTKIQTYQLPLINIVWNPSTEVWRHLWKAGTVFVDNPSATPIRALHSITSLIELFILFHVFRFDCLRFTATFQITIRRYFSVRFPRHSPPLRLAYFNSSHIIFRLHNFRCLWIDWAISVHTRFSYTIFVNLFVGVLPSVSA